ncbi:hypothetical protein HCN44_000132 [Aphidius gifuensis]|uniref:Solute carrier organic anion transporter family member n=1 Tax=Aphidius gifuensis TaxID=684658 RepID=A0A834XPG8_APHGI|nr:solute carrier organic anion transporter family member 74D [Aphidius gifuensis]XP_044012481.1 solute carrier organic anion transporter family member 74D [Aphidius gifuensis]KAF7990327.1 hypothetical protein HCN44_000132 [Aphidius gifuensis]
MSEKKIKYCGLFGYYPKWLQKYANSKIFIIVYGFLGLVQAMAFIYMTVTLTTLEKRFKIPSQTTGLILSGNEISQILSLILIYYGGVGHRPKWLAVGVGLSSLSCFILVIPHLIYGPGEAALALTQEYLAKNIKMNTTQKSDFLPICNDKNSIKEICANDDWSDDDGIVPRFLIFFSQFVLGIGTTLYFGLGQTYLDDNSKKSNTPMLLGVTFALRTFGPAVGFILAYFCMKIYIVPDLHPIINEKDPRWLGAWWLGWIFLGLLLAIFSLLIALFPRELPKKLHKISNDKNMTEVEVPLNIENNLQKNLNDIDELNNLSIEKIDSQQDDEPNIKDFFTTLIRVCSNKILLCNNLSAVFGILGVIPYMTFIAKYLEVQFETSAGGGTVITGPISLISMVLGFFFSGWFISKFNPRPSRLLSWNVFGGTLWAVVQIILIFNTCEIIEHHGIDRQNLIINLTDTCNVNCNCDDSKYSPVCHQATKTTFMSPCHAGCKNSNDTKSYYNCSCVDLSLKKNYNNDTVINDSVTVGPCKGDCTNAYIIFMILIMICNFISATERIGNVLVNYRCVDKKDKSISQGVTLMIVSLFALIPGPILYGAIIDKSCLLWENSCGENGNCWHYDKEKFRLLFNTTASFFTFIGVLFDVGVCYLARNVDLYGKNDDDKGIIFIQDEANIVKYKKTKKVSDNIT